MCFDILGILNNAAGIDYRCEGLGGKVTSIDQFVSGFACRNNGGKLNETYVCFRCSDAKLFLTWLYWEYFERISLSILAASWNCG